MTLPLPNPASRGSHRRVALVSLLSLFGCIGLAASFGATPVPEPRRLESFQLADQFGTVHVIAFPRPRPLLLLIGDRRGSEDIDAWIEPLKRRWGATADLHGIADVQAVPRFLRGRITEAIRKSRPKPLLLDFDGRVTSVLPCEKKAANIFAIAPDGRLLARISGPYPSGTNADVKLAVLEKALSAPDP